MKIDVRNHRLNEVGLSVEKFAEAVGVSPDVIRNLEATGNRPRPENAVRVAKYFSEQPGFEGTQVADLWPAKDDPPPVVVGQVRKVER